MPGRRLTPMHVYANDTIVAIATAAGRGGIGIVRVSGPGSRTIAAAILGRLPQPRRALHAVFRDAGGEAIDDGIALFFPAPHSFTGEDVLELQGHGGPVVLDLVLRACLGHGARMAAPGEFSQRAFLNDRLDLAQAEAIADLIEAGSAQAARAALRSLQGAFSRQVHALVEGLIALRMHVEAAIDFPEEEIDFLADERIRAQAGALRAQVEQIIAAARQGCLLRDGMNVVIAGRPNAGKSSLLNAMAGRDTAIVTEVPGTTRDVLREHINIDGMPVQFVDTAGLRETADQVERIGVERAWKAIAEADRIVLVLDDREGFTAQERAILDALPTNVPVTRLHNKIDLTDTPAGWISETPAALALSARTGAGIDLLRSHLKQAVGYHSDGGGEFLARRRHLDALHAAGLHLDAAYDRLDQGAGELAAEELRLAQRTLGEITGEFSNEDLLGRIFSSFCIGK